MHGLALADRHRQRRGAVGRGLRIARREAVGADLAQDRAQAEFLPLAEAALRIGAQAGEMPLALVVRTERQMRAAHRGPLQVRPQPQHRIGVRPRADRAGPELDRDRVAVERADPDRPFEPARQLDRERARRLDDLRDPLVARGQLMHAAGHPVAAAHVVARHIAFGGQRLQHPHDGRLGKAGRLVDRLHRGDAQPVDGAQHVERAADRLHRRIGALRRIGRAAARIGAAAPLRIGPRLGAQVRLADQRFVRRDARDHVVLPAARASCCVARRDRL